MVSLGLDETDISILQMLLEDSRVPQTKMAERLNIPLSTVQTRLNRLREDAIDRFTVLIDPRKINLMTYLIHLTTDVSNIKTIVGQIEDEDYVTDVYYSEDGEIVMRAICSAEKFNGFYEKLVAAVGDKVSAITLLTQPSVEKHTSVVSPSEIAGLMGKADKKKQADLSLLSLLLGDSRSTQSEMAKKLGIPQSTLQKRLNKLTRDVIDRYTLVVDPRKVGLDTYMAHLTVANVLHVNDIVGMLEEERCISEVFHREDGEIFFKSICPPGSFIDFYSRLQDRFRGKIKNAVLLSKPNVVKHSSVIHSSILDGLKED